MTKLKELSDSRQVCTKYVLMKRSVQAGHWYGKQINITNFVSGSKLWCQEYCLERFLKLILIPVAPLTENCGKNASILINKFHYLFAILIFWGSKKIIYTHNEWSSVPADLLNNSLQIMMLDFFVKIWHFIFHHNLNGLSLYTSTVSEKKKVTHYTLLFRVTHPKSNF